MKRNFFVLTWILIAITEITSGQGIAINNDGSAPDPQAMLDIKSTSKGLLIPRMTTAQRNAMLFPPMGMMVFDTDTRSFWFRGLGVWTETVNALNNRWINSGYQSSINKDSLPVEISSGNSATMESPLTIQKSGAPTGIENVLTIYRRSDAPATNGIGGAILFRNESTSNGMIPNGRISSIAEVNSPATYSGALRFDVFNSTGATIPQLYINPEGVVMGGTFIDASAIVDIQSNNKGLLIPRMTTPNRQNIQFKATGLMVFDTNTRTFWFWTGTEWREFGNPGVTYWNSNSFGYNNYNSNLPLMIGNTLNGIPNGSLNVLKEGAAAGLEDVLTIQRSSVATPVSGIGGSIFFRNGAPGNSFSTSARISSVTDDMDGSAHSLQFTAYSAGSGTPQLYINSQGVGIGKTTVAPTARMDVNGNVRIDGELNRPSTGASNMIPICYGVVNATGALLSGTTNYSCSKIAVGHYEITVAGQALNTTTDVINVTPIVFNGARMVTVNSSGNAVRVFIYSSTGALIDTQFNFIIYKL